jgi:hypothetical protein
MEKEVSEAERRVAIKKIYSEKIALLIKRDVDEKELYEIIRHFFADFLKLEYAFTYEELSQELNKIFIKQALKQRIDKMLSDLSWLEYMPDHEITQEEKRKILNDFEDMIEQLIFDLEEKPGKISFFDKLLGRKTGEKEVRAPNTMQQDSSPESLPNMDVDEVRQKNQDALQELRSEIVQKEESKQVFNDFVNNMDESNNLLLFTEPSDKKSRAIKKETRTPPQEFVQANITEFPPEISGAFPKISETTLKSINPSLLAEDNNPEMIAMKELIEKSYNFFSLGDYDSAKLRYMDALSIYRLFDYDKKTRAYLVLYDLYTKLK